MHGPIDYLVVGFNGSAFDGSILRALEDAIDNGVIALVALSVIAKDTEGAMKTLNVADLGDQYLVDFVSTNATNASAVNDTDLQEVAELLEDDTAAGLLVVEHLWAKPLKQAIIDAGGYLVADGRIHPDAAAELDKEEV